MEHAPTRRAFGLSLASLAVSTQLVGCQSPRRASPVTAIDCHAHVFRRDLPMPDRRRAPSGYDATPEDFIAVLEANGMSNGVLVQPSFLGTDNSYLVAALRRYPTRFRGIAVVAPESSDIELARLNDAGVVGIRLNLIGLPTPDFNSPPWKALLTRLRALRWHVEVHQLARELEPVVDPLLSAGLDVAIDHFGRPDPLRGIDDPGFGYLLSLGASKKVWVKLSGSYRNGSNGAGDATAIAAMPLLKRSFGIDRLIWGSDWPHTLFESTATYAHQRSLLDRCVPDADERDTVLRRNPQALFRFA